MDDAIIDDKQTKITKEKANEYEFYERGIRNGLVSGLMISTYLLILRAFNQGGNMSLKILAFLILTGAIAYEIKQRKEQVKTGTLFKKGILIGMFISFIAASTILLFESAVFLLDYEWLVPMFKNKITGVIEFATFASIMFLETILYGLISTFIILQYYKTSKVR
jgi:hypothetical protein